MSTIVKEAREALKHKKFKSIKVDSPVEPQVEQIGEDEKELSFTVTLDVKIKMNGEHKVSELPQEAFSNWAGNIFSHTVA